MSVDISPETVAQMLEGVTAGPWTVEIDKRTWGWVDVKGPSINVGGPTHATDLGPADEIARKADARFIAWARESVPALAARVAELEAERAVDAAKSCLSTPEAVVKMIARLRSQIGDDVQDVCVPEALYALSADMIEWLLKDIFASQKREHDANAAAMTHLRRAESAEADVAKLRKALMKIVATPNGALDSTATEATLRRDLVRVREELRDLIWPLPDALQETKP
jgi:hypothetical protein